MRGLELKRTMGKALVLPGSPLINTTNMGSLVQKINKNRNHRTGHHMHPTFKDGTYDGNLKTFLDYRYSIYYWVEKHL